MTHQQKIIYTYTDEAPALATLSLLPIIRAFTQPARIIIELKDISLAGRILSNFSEFLNEDQRTEKTMEILAKLVKEPTTNLIKLPNISASLPQLLAAIKELQSQGFAIPDYPENANTVGENKIKEKYDLIKGSSVNPVLREGNSDRRVPNAVKEYARSYPYKIGQWNTNSKSHVSSMADGDFFGSEKSVTISKYTLAKIQHISDTETVILKNNIPLKKDEIVDTSVMNMNKLKTFIQTEITDAKQKKVLFSLHLKATMMKVSDPIIFGTVVSEFYSDFFEKHKTLLDQLNINPNHGLKALFDAIDTLETAQKELLLNELAETDQKKPDLAMVNSDKGITNLHVPSDIIIDASMPAMIRSSGQMWDKDGKLKDVKAVIPDRTYAGIYQAVIEDCKNNGALDPAVIGSVPNVGLMAQKAEEYGSHDKTFQLQSAGVVQVVDENENILLEQVVEAGDIFRMCQLKDEPVRNWVQLVIKRAKSTGDDVIFWLDQHRPHDAELIKKVKAYLKTGNSTDVHIEIMPPKEATLFSLEKIRNGKNIISATGNVLRDYLTDLFPILEVGTSAKMLSIVPLLNGGMLFETGAGGSAPKHVQQFSHEGHLRWDSLGEFLALAESLSFFGETHNNHEAKLLSKTLEIATSKLLKENKSPSRKVREIDNRGSHFYLALYWSQVLATQKESISMKEIFSKVAAQLSENEKQINNELLSSQGQPVDLGGYYRPIRTLATDTMRPSQTLNQIIETLRSIS